MNNPISKKPKMVGQFIRNRRELLKVSQRSLGSMLSPPVTTQFISNIERGVTSLPPSHVPLLAKALQVSEHEILVILEHEYTQKLSDQLGHENKGHAGDSEFVSWLISAFQSAPPDVKEGFKTQAKELFFRLNSAQKKDVA